LGDAIRSAAISPLVICRSPLHEADRVEDPLASKLGFGDERQAGQHRPEHSAIGARGQYDRRPRVAALQSRQIFNEQAYPLRRMKPSLTRGRDPLPPDPCGHE
jgi:hypothetical protein